jgi:peptide chain release factor subunit 1
MITIEELKEIASINPGEDHYVTLYLNVDPVTNPGGEYLVKFKNMMKETSEKTDKKVLKAIRGDLEAMENYFIGNKRKFRKALCLISARKGGFWKEFHLSVPVASGIFVDRTPYLKPVMGVMDDFPRHLVLLVDKEKARIFVVHMGEVAEYGEVRTPDIPAKQKKAGWFALEAGHIERHVDFHVALHIQDVAEHAAGFMEKQKIECVIIGGPQEAVSMTMEKLPKAVREKVIGAFAAGMYETSAEILRKAEPVLREHNGKMDASRVDELLARTLKNEQAVVGLEDVVLMLEEGRVMELVIDADYGEKGFVCSNCRKLSAEPGACRFCGGPARDIGYMGDLVMQKTVEKGGRVNVVGGNDKLKGAGGIGALLRY